MFVTSEPILTILFYLKAGTFRVIPFWFGPELMSFFLLIFPFLFNIGCMLWQSPLSDNRSRNYRSSSQLDIPLQLFYHTKLSVTAKLGLTMFKVKYILQYFLLKSSYNGWLIANTKQTPIRCREPPRLLLYKHPLLSWITTFCQKTWTLWIRNLRLCQGEALKVNISTRAWDEPY